MVLTKVIPTKLCVYRIRHSYVNYIIAITFVNIILAYYILTDVRREGISVVTRPVSKLASLFSFSHKLAQFGFESLT